MSGRHEADARAIRSELPGSPHTSWGLTEGDLDLWMAMYLTYSLVECCVAFCLDMARSGAERAVLRSQQCRAPYGYNATN